MKNLRKWYAMLKQLSSLIRQDAAKVERESANAASGGSSTAIQALLEPGHEVLQTGEALKEVLFCLQFLSSFSFHCNCAGPLFGHCSQ
jgi:hypothetical protein